LPRLRIKGADIAGKIVLQKHPAAADFGAWDGAGFGTMPQLLGVAAEKRRCFLKADGFHLRVDTYEYPEACISSRRFQPDETWWSASQRKAARLSATAGLSQMWRATPWA
jgi:hypothetical protein